MGGLARLGQLIRIVIVSHLLYGLALMVMTAGLVLTPELAASFYGLTLAGALAASMWPFGLALYHQRALEHLRKSRGGVVDHASWLSPLPVWRFADEHAKGRIEIRIASHGPGTPVILVHTTLRAHDDAPGRVRLAIKAQPARPSALGLTGSPLGDPDFDDRFSFAAGSPSQVEALLAEGLRAPLLELLQLSVNLDVLELAYDGVQLTVSRSLAVRWQEDWSSWAVRIAERTSAQIFLVLRAVETRFSLEPETALALEAAELAIGEDVDCPVCAAALTPRPEVQCRAAICLACESPHHLECWIYNGQCALFGCGSTLCREQVISRMERREALGD